MTDLPPNSPPPPIPVQLTYATPMPGGSAPLLVRLAGIFTLISAGIDLLHLLITAGMLIFMHYFFTKLTASMAAAAAAPTTFPGSGPATTATGTLPALGPAIPPPTVLPAMTPMYLTYGGAAVLSLIACGFLVYGGTKLLRLRQNAWGWGLAMGILCVAHVWLWVPCCFLWIPTLAAGVYTIIVMCLDHVRRYLHYAPSQSHS